jgi:hypothetical protein
VTNGTDPSPILAQLINSDTATAAGLTVHSPTPLLDLCRRLLAAGVDPTRPRLSKAAARGTAAGKAAADQFAANVLPVIREIQASGVTSHNAISAKLNERKVKTARGGRWSHVQVGMIMARTPVADEPE